MTDQFSIINPHPKKIPGPSLLHDLVANEGPAAIEFLSAHGATELLTYHHLHHKADALARALRWRFDQSKNSNQTSPIVPILLPQCPSLYIAELAVLKAGGTFCPIALDVPRERLRFILQDVDAKIIITTAELRDGLSDLPSVSIIAIDDINTSDESSECLPTNVEPSQPAYIMYTSGSTGQPKGVIVSHSAVTQALLAHNRHIPKFSRFLQFASPTFDVSVFEVFFTLFRGCTLVCCDRRQLLNDLPGFINRMHVDAAELTPSVTSSLFHGRRSVPGLTMLLTIGEMLKRDVIEGFGGSETVDSILYGMYGPTEAAVHCTMQTECSQDMSVGNIGIPLDTVTAFVVKPVGVGSPEAVEVLPMGEDGELAIGGHQLADGYLNRVEQTNSAFVNHPQYGRLYRTGDRARVTPTGQLECLGRITHGQVKLRGQRIELGEIEYAASQTPGCRSTVAEMIGASLVAFCVFDAPTLSSNDVLNVCRQWLPAFMVPSDVMLIGSLPYLPSGKVDRAGLHELYSKAQCSSAVKNEELTSRSKAIIEIISDVLRAHIDGDTQLSAAGLDSLSSIRIASRLERAGFAQPNATVLLESRTANDLAREVANLERTQTVKDFDMYEEACSSLRTAVTNNELTSLRLDNIEDVYVPTPLQTAMLSETARESQAYCNWVEMAIADHSTIDEVEYSLRKLAQQHVLLRSGFLAVTNGPSLHAGIVWKYLRQAQIRQVDRFEYEFRLANDADLLHPCTFQLMSSKDGVRILLQAHHSLYDQWSLDVFRADLSAALTAKAVTARPPYEVVSRFQTRHLEEARSEQHLSFWQDHLRGFAPTTLPGINGQRLPRKLQRTSWQDLQINLATTKSKLRKCGMSMSTLFQAATAFLLGCYAGCTDVTHGVVFSGRHLPIPQIQHVFGPCLLTLPFRIDYSTTRTSWDLLRAIQERTRTMQKHALTPLSDIKGAVQSLPGRSLFDTLFVWQETSLREHQDTGIVSEVDSADHHEFNLVLEFEPSEDAVRIRATYQQALLSTAQVHMLFCQIEAVANYIINEPKGLVQDLATSLPQHLRSVSNLQPARCAAGRSLLASLDKHVQTDPTAPALVFAKSIDEDGAQIEMITYKGLDDRANKLANYLQSINAGPGQLVCICMEKSVELYVAILATIKAGSGYLPLTPETPALRVRSVIEQASVKLSLCDRESTRTFASFPDMVTVDVSRPDWHHTEPAPPKAVFPGSGVAYTIYTSGSTGEPKGVAVTMDNLVGNLQALAELYQVSRTDRLLQACSQAFDVSVFEIFFAFYTGMCLCFARKDVLFQDLGNSIRALGITHLSLTPTVAALVHPDTIPSVRFLVTAGEGVTDLVHRLWAGKGLLHQGYGPSETTNICTVNMNVSADDVLGNVGKPLRNTSAFVISSGEDFALLPAGAVGELAFGGEQVFRGYLANHDLNAKKLIHHTTFGLIYRSGDLGRILPDGSLLICGRLDDQFVKLRGNRIELGEINSVALQDFHIRDATTLVIGDDTRDQTLVLFVVTDQGRIKVKDKERLADMDVDHLARLYEHLNMSLPSYMIPGLIVPINDMPLNSQGKLDKRSLERFVGTLNSETRGRLGQSGAEPVTGDDWSSDEHQIAAALAEILRVPSHEIGRNTSFFGLGLNSLSAIALSKLITHRLRKNATVSTILRSPTTARLARSLVVEAAPTTLSEQSNLHSLLPTNVMEDVRRSCASLGGNIERILPCTALQEAMLSATVSRSQSSYCNTMTLRVVASLPTLRHCWAGVVARHAIFRTHFVSTSSPAHLYAQVVLKKMDVPWFHENLRHSTNLDSADELPAYDVSHFVDAANPFRINAYTSAQNTAVVLVLNMHHAIYDSISMSLVLEEVEALYRGQTLPPAPSFEPFLAELREHNGKDATDFWSSHLVGFRPIKFPKPCPGGHSVEHVIDQKLTVSSKDLDVFCKRYEISHLSVVQCALAKTLSLCQQSKDICFGNVVSGRTVAVEGIERLVAPCFNTIPVRCDLSSKRSLLDVIHSLNSLNVDALAYQLAPLRRLQRLSALPDRRLFECLLLLQPPSRELDQNIWTAEQESGTMDMPLVYEITPTEGNYRLLLHYMQPHISQSLAQAVHRAFDRTLSVILRYPLSDPNDIHGLDEEELAGALGDKYDEEEEGQRTHSVASQRWTTDEERIRQVFAGLAGVERSQIRRDTSLHQIGLDSLNAVQVARQLQSFGFNVDAVDVIETQTPSLLATLVGRKALETAPTTEQTDLDTFDRQQRRSVLDRLRLNDDELEAVRPCTAMQSGMLAQSSRTRGGLYINHVAFRVPTSSSVADVRRAWQAVTAKHQVLRMGFHHLEETSFVMSILGPHYADVPLVEISGGIDLPAVENDAFDSILRSLGTQAWQVALQPNEGTLVMVLSLHHALYDANGLRTILTDLANALSLDDIGPGTSIDPILSSLLAAETQNDASTEEFWTGALRDASVSRFPDLSPVVAGKTELQSQSQICSLRLPDIASYCRRNSATIQALGQTVWALLLNAYTGDTNIVFGTVFAGTPTPATEAVVFPTITTIPVKSNLDCSDSEVLRNMVEFNASVQRHRFAPLTDIQRFAGHAGRSLFDTVFMYQKSSSLKSPFDWPILRETAAVDYTASLELESSSDDNILLRLTFDPSRIPHNHAGMILKQYDRLLSQIVLGVSSEDTYAHDIYSIRSAKEWHLPCESQLLHGLVECSARQYPERVALEFVHDRQNTNTWTYAQLNRRGSQVAHLIKQSGAQSNSIVAVRMTKSPEASFAFLGILKAGCVFLAIDPDLPESRLSFILQDSGATLLFVNESQSLGDGSNCVHTIALTESLIADQPDSTMHVGAIQPDAAAYCLYTSGTTGNPKGCEITHENTVQAMMAFKRLFAGRYNATSRWLQFASYWFDVSVLEQFWSWAVGITVIGAGRDLVLEDLSGFLREYKITHLDLTPSLARLLEPKDVPKLCGGVFITGGEALKQDIIDAWGPTHTVCNGYGPTEATIGVTMNTFIGSDAKPSNIGRQFDNVGTYVLRPSSDEPVLCGAVGELCISGKLVGKGYLNRPDLTSSAFPFLARFDERVYRTGDLVRLLADGSFAFVGRQDTQTKLRGQRLEITEIDNVIRASTDQVTDVVTLLVKSEKGEKESLVSFLPTNSGRRAQQLQLSLSAESRRLARAAKEACMAKLPNYMVPTHVLPVSHMPLTANNKIDEKRLASLFNATAPKDLQTLEDLDRHTEILTSTEENIVMLLSEMLLFPPAGVTSGANLFSLGLSSVTAISFSGILKRRGYGNASVGMILSNPTVGSLGKALSTESSDHSSERSSVVQAKLRMSAFAQRHSHAAALMLSLTLDDIEAVVPCTPLQQGLIVGSMKDKDKAMYFNDFCYSIERANVQRLRWAFQVLVEGTQVLRTSFLSTEEGFAQVVSRRKLVPFSEWRVAAEDQEARLIDLKSRWVASNHDELSSPIEIHVLLCPTSTTLVLHIHHSLYDGISYDLLISRLSDIYNCESSIDFGPSFTSSLPYGPLQMATRAQEFWTKALTSHNYISPRAQGTFASEEDAIVSLRLRTTASLEAVRKNLGVSHQALVQASFEVALRQRLPFVQTYGIVVSGRSIELDGADRILGPMFNTLPQHLDIDADETLSRHVCRLHSHNIEMLPFQHTSLRDIRKWCGRHPSDPMFDVLFVFQHRAVSDTAKSDRLLRLLNKPISADYPLACEVELGANGRIDVSLVAQASYCDQSVLGALCESFKIALEHVSNGSNVSVKEAFGLTSMPNSRGSEEGSSVPQMNGVHDFEWTAHARSIRQAISQLSGIDIADVDEHATIFALGLDSIDAVKLASQLKRSGISLAVSKILQAQTIPRMLGMAQQCFLTMDLQEDGSRFSAIEQQLRNSKLIQPLHTLSHVQRVLPATPHQEALIADMLRSSFREYLNHDVLHLRPHTDLNRLKKAWQVVVDASPILRTSFLDLPDPEIDATFAQVVHQCHPVRFDEAILETFGDVGQLLDETQEEIQANLHVRPLLRLTIASVGAEHYLILSLSHAQYDGHSLALLHDDVQRAYNGTLKPRPPYDQAIAAALASASGDAESFWAETLSGASARKFPTLNRNGEEHKTNRAEKFCELSSDTARSFCRDHRVSMQALAQTCWAITLSHYTQSLEVLFGVVLACRDSEQAEQIMFPMMNTIVIRSALHGTRTQMLQYMQSIINDMRPYQRTPLRTIQAAAASVVRKADPTLGTRLFDSLFIYQHRPGQSKDPSEPLYESVGGSSNVEFPVAVEMEVIGHQVVTRAACKDIILDEHGIVELLDQFDEVLCSLIHSPNDMTVDFDGDMTSICGLDPFPSRILGDVSSDATVENQSDKEETPAKSDSALVLTIMDALSQVSKVSVHELTSMSTIESIGIDSISAIKVATLLRNQSINLTVSDIIRARNAAQMAEVATSTANRAADSEELSRDIVATVVGQHRLDEVARRIGHDPSNVEMALPATAGQVYMLSMWQKTGGQLFYPTFSYQLQGQWDPAKVKQAWVALVARHPVLRTVFLATEDPDLPLLQVVLKDVITSSIQDNEAVSQQSAVQPMIRLRVNENDEGVVLALDISHCLYDAVSLPILMLDFHTLLTGVQLSPSKLRFKDFIALSITRRAIQEREKFWCHYLRDAKPIQLKQPAANGPQRRVEIFSPRLSPGAQELERIARKENLSTQALLFAAYAKVYDGVAKKLNVRGSSQAADVVLGIYFSNRSHLAELDSLAAPTVSLIPLLVRSTAQKTLLDSAKEIQADLHEIGTAENSAVSLWEIANWTGVKVDTFFNFLKLPGRDNDKQESSLELRALGEKGKQERRLVVEPSEVESEPRPELRRLLLTDAYQHSVDIEMTIKDGKLDVGLFCPEAMLGLEDAEGALEELREILEKLVGQSEV